MIPKTTMLSHSRNHTSGLFNVITTIEFLFLCPTYLLFHNFSVSRSSKTKILSLLDSGTSICFLDEKYAKRHKIRLVQKAKCIHVDVIDKRSLLSGSVTHEFEPIEVTFK